MTQPESSVPAAAAGKIELSDDKLSIESIGWLFIDKYYTTYTSDITKLFAFYDKHASLLHDEFPDMATEATGSSSDGASSIKTVNLATGTEAIKKHFAAQSLVTETNKIVVERADFQKSVSDSILIVVCGSWKRGSCQLLQFVQTFVLKAKDKTVYDVSNDLLKFVDLSEQFSQQEVRAVDANGHAEEKVGETEKEMVEKVDKVDKVEKVEKVEKDEKVAKVEKVTEKPVKVEKSEEKVEKTEKTERADKPEKVDKTNKVQEPAEKSENQDKPETDSGESANEAKEPETEQKKEEKPFSLSPAVKPTWANLAAIEPKVPKATSQSPKATPVAAKKSTPPATQVAPTVPANGKFKKEEWYPIYIRNIEVDDEDLRGALVKQFGDIKFFKRTQKTALCDFRNKEDQQKALEAKEIVVKNNVILLETRVHKSFNGKPDFKKDKKQVKKSGVKKN
ncbi:CIC11C00000001039 [Sungouiella intermedia]|uniref:CIC11C00000001039 n=1 Tax=Sungouiella intermedia TaxID=45354 RepID=A0A1L0BNB5_9ASCO|nr:CIC11C00000001039 [[Candida] intermedia]